MIEAEEKKAVGQHNLLLREASRLYDHFTGRDKESIDTRRRGKGISSLEKLVRDQKTEDPASVPAWDVISAALKDDGRFAGLLAPDPDDPDDSGGRGQDTLDLVNQGRRQVRDKGAIYREALDYLIDSKEIQRAAEEATRAGQSDRAAREALHAGAEDGQEDGRDEAVAPAAPGDAEDDRGRGDADESGLAGPVPDFDFGRDAEPGPGGAGAGPEPGSGRPGDPLLKDFVDFVRGEEGHIAIGEPTAEALKRLKERYGPYLGDKWEAFKKQFFAARDAVGKLGGWIAPRTTRLSQAAGEAMARFMAAGTRARWATPLMIDKILGKGATAQDRVFAGAVLTEWRLRYMRQAYQKRAEAMSNYGVQWKQRAEALAAKGAERWEIDQARQRSRDAFTEADKAAKASREVKTTLGWEGNPLKTTEDYRRGLQQLKDQGVFDRWQKFMVPEMEENFRKAMGMEDDDPIRSFTQHPDNPINLASMGPDDPDTATTAKERPTGRAAGRGNLLGARQGKYVFSEQATGTAAKYDLDLGKIIENSLARGYANSSKAEMFRTFVSEGVAKWGKPGEAHYFDGVRAKGDLDVRPPRGTQEAEAGQTTLYAHPDVYGELRQALGQDQPARIPGITWFAENAINKATLASTVEGLTHLKNMGTMLFRPGMSVVDLAKNAWGVATGDTATRERIVELARIGAMKDPGFESGQLLPQGLAKCDPTTYMGKAIDALGQVMRLTADDAFERMAGKKDGFISRALYGEGRVVDTETNRRNFINQLGNYNRRAQSKIVAFLRDTGLAPFATAGSNYNMQGLSSLVMDPGVEANSYKAAVQLRAEMLARTLIPLAAVGVANFLRWGRIDGDDKTPIGSLKVGEEGGKTQYLPLLDWTGASRGARQTGAMALGEGVRAGRSEGKTFDRAADDFVNSWSHVGAGPLPQAAYTAYTGKNMLGMQLAPKARPHQSQEVQNFLTALKNVNPVAAALTGANRPPNHPPTWPQRANELAGPFGVKERATKPGAEPLTRR